VLNNEKVQIARDPSITNDDQVNMGLTFTYFAAGPCTSSDDALKSGIVVGLYAGSCGHLVGTGLKLDLDPFVVHTVGGKSYGTLFQSSPTVPAPETVSASITALATPAGACGQWALNVEVGGVYTPALGLGGGNPFALVLWKSDYQAYGCFNVNDAVVGNRIPPPTRKVSRRARGRK
jgi:hypothetical protein